MTSTSGPEAPSRRDEQALMLGYYDSYSKWVGDAESKRNKDLSTTQASFAVQGVGVNDPIYQSAVDRVNTTYEDTIAEIEAGQTFSSLNKYYENRIESNKGGTGLGNIFEDTKFSIENQQKGVGISDIKDMGFKEYYDAISTQKQDSAIEEKKKVQEASRSEAQRAAAGSGVDGKRQRAQGTGASEESPWW